MSKHEILTKTSEGSKLSSVDDCYLFSFFKKKKLLGAENETSFYLQIDWNLKT